MLDRVGPSERHGPLYLTPMSIATKARHVFLFWMQTKWIYTPQIMITWIKIIGLSIITTKANFVYNWCIIWNCSTIVFAFWELDGSRNGIECHETRELPHLECMLLTKCGSCCYHVFLSCPTSLSLYDHHLHQSTYLDSQTKFQAHSSLKAI